MSVSRVTLPPELIGRKIRIPAKLIDFELVKKEKGFVAVVNKKPILLAYEVCGARHWYEIYLMTMPHGAIFIPFEEPREVEEVWGGKVKVVAERMLPHGRLYVYIYNAKHYLAREGFLVFDVVSENEMKISKDQQNYDYTLLVINHYCQSRVHRARLDVIGAKVIAEEYTATTLDSATTKVVLVPRDEKFAIVKNTCPYRGGDEYEVCICDENGKCTSHGLYLSMDDARGTANELLAGSQEQEEVII